MEERFRILLIDDDEVDRMMVRRALGASGVKADFDEAADGRSALEALAKREYDCALLDYRLPDGDGMAILRAARAAGSAVPIVLLTGQGDVQLAVELRRRGRTTTCRRPA